MTFFWLVDLVLNFGPCVLPPMTLSSWTILLCNWLVQYHFCKPVNKMREGLTDKVPPDYSILCATYSLPTPRQACMVLHILLITVTAVNLQLATKRLSIDGDMPEMISLALCSELQTKAKAISQTGKSQCCLLNSVFFSSATRSVI